MSRNPVRWFAVTLAVVLALATLGPARSQTERTVEPSTSAEVTPAPTTTEPDAQTPPEPLPTTEARPPEPAPKRPKARSDKPPEPAKRERPSSSSTANRGDAAPESTRTEDRPRTTVIPSPKQTLRVEPSLSRAAEDEPQPTTMTPERPATWVDAYWKVRTILETRFNNADYWGCFLEAVSVLRGNRLMREYLDNERYLQWTLISLSLLLVGQAALFAYMGAPIRRMAVLLPRRPLGPVLLGFVGVAVILLLSVGLVYSFVGIPIAVALWAFLYAAAIAGKMGLFLSIGWGISRAFGGRGGSVLPFFVVYLVYVALVILDPFSTGRVFFVAANLVGIGLALRTRFGFGVRASEPPPNERLRQAGSENDRTRL